MSHIKQIVNTFFKLLPFKKAVFSFIRLFGVPARYKSFRFSGSFRLTLSPKTSVLLLNSGDYSLETEWFWRGINGWEAVSIQIWNKLCASGILGRSPVICDIGACEGIYALTANALSPGAVVLGMEPLEAAFERLKHNIALNHCRVIPINAAASTKDGVAELFIDDQTSSTEASLMSAQLKGSVGSCSVVTRSVASIIEERKLKSMDLVKIDVEGAELGVLQGMGEYLSKYRPVMILEVLSSTAGEEINGLMAGLNYRYWDINDDPRNGPLGIRADVVIKKGVCLNWLLVPAEKVEFLEDCWRTWYLK
jgi:FkbM family methyltransferase